MAIVMSVVLGASKPKKDAVIAQVAPTVDTGEVGIYVDNTGFTDNPQQLVGDLHKLFRWMKSNLNKQIAQIEMPIGGSDPQIVPGIGGAGKVALYFGTVLLAGEKSHFLDRTFKRLIEVALEEYKNAVVADPRSGPLPPPIPASNINKMSETEYRLEGTWQEGQQFAFSASFTDADGDLDVQEDQNIVLPTGAPPGGWDSNIAAAVIAGAIGALPHLRGDEGPITGQVFATLLDPVTNTLISTTLTALPLPPLDL